MKKLRNLFLIAVVCLTGVLFTDKVFAAPIIEYPVFSGKIYYNKTKDHECYSTTDNNCKEYTISEDDGISDKDIKLTNGDDSFIIDKVNISTGYVVSATKPLDLKIPSNIDYHIDDVMSIKEVTKIVYYRGGTNNIIKNAKKYDNIVTYAVAPDKDFIVPENVTVTACSVGNEAEAAYIVNNGIIKTNLMYTILKISGNGVINISYANDYAGMTDVYNVSGVKFNIIDTEIKEGLKFGYIQADTKEKAQEDIDMYNKVLGDTLNGYELKLMGGTEDEYEYYYGSLVKKVTQVATTTVKKDEVKNPKTGDNILYIVGLSVLSVIVFGIAYKKIKQN